MGIAGDQAPTSQSLQPGMLHDTFHQPFSQAAGAERFQHEYVSNISVGRVVGDNASETDLLAFHIHSEAQRVPDGTGDDVASDSLGPVASGQETMNHV